ncbi:hypothetical protein R1flu_029197 [Riccia fluitans]|uniref:SWIM-type domain-containing protein n=1 Tax=Riccia fluitans TaxID=41844 RepID=A0ABD1XNW3_9MARC
MADVFPVSIHGHCTLHIRTNVQAKFGKEAAKIFTKLLYVPTVERFDLMMKSTFHFLEGGGACTCKEFQEMCWPCSHAICMVHEEIEEPKQTLIPSEESVLNDRMHLLHKSLSSPSFAGGIISDKAANC